MSVPPFDKVTSTAPLVTMTVAKDHLRVTDTAHDADLTIKLRQATDSILDYLKAGADPTWTTETVPAPVQAAILKLLGHLDADRGDADSENNADKVWAEIDRLLVRFRDPALA